MCNMHTFLYTCTCNFNFMGSRAYTEHVTGFINFQIIAMAFLCVILILHYPQNLVFDHVDKPFLSHHAL